MLKWLHCFGFVALVVSSALKAQVVRQDSALVDSPEGKLVVLNVKAGAPAKLVKRQGFWVQVEVGGKTGWMKVSALSFSEGVGGTIQIDTGRMSHSNIVSTSAARGLSAKDLLSGKPSLEELLLLESQSRPNSQQVLKTFLSEGGIVSTSGEVRLIAPPRFVATGGVIEPEGAKGRPKNKEDDDW